MPSLSRRHLFTPRQAPPRLPPCRVLLSPKLLPPHRQRPPPRPGRSRCRRSPIPFNALEPHIDAKTMEIHHDRHHQAFITNLNNLAKTNPQLGTAAITDVLGNLNALNDDIKFTVRNNLGGHANHTMFWEIMGPGGGGKPEGDLAGRDRQGSRRHGKIPERF